MKKPAILIVVLLILLIVSVSFVFMAMYFHGIFGSFGQNNYEHDHKEPPTLIFVNNSSKKINEVTIDFKNEHILLENIDVGNKVSYLLSGTSSGDFEIKFRIKFNDGEIKQESFNMKRPKNRPVLQVSINEKGQISFR